MGPRKISKLGEMGERSRLQMWTGSDAGDHESGSRINAIARWTGGQNMGDGWARDHSADVKQRVAAGPDSPMKQ